MYFFLKSILGNSLFILAETFKKENRKKTEPEADTKNGKFSLNL